MCEFRTACFPLLSSLVCQVAAPWMACQSIVSFFACCLLFIVELVGVGQVPAPSMQALSACLAWLCPSVSVKIPLKMIPSLYCTHGAAGLPGFIVYVNHMWGIQPTSTRLLACTYTACIYIYMYTYNQVIKVSSHPLEALNGVCGVQGARSTIAEEVPSRNEDVIIL